MYAVETFQLRPKFVEVDRTTMVVVTNSYQEPGELQIRERLVPFGVTPTDEQIVRIREYLRLLLLWNRSINLTAVTDPFEIIERQANVVTSRAVGGFKELIPWCARALTDRGHIVLWVGAEDSTGIARSRTWNWQPPQRIPGSKARFILIGRPIRKASKPG